MRDAQQAIAAMELAGVAFDAEGHTAFVEDWRQKRTRSKGKLPEALDLGKDEAIRAWIKEHLSPELLKYLKRTNEGKISLADENLAICPHPEITALREYRRLNLLIARYEDFPSYLDPNSGRIHSQYLLGGTATGRTTNCAPCLHNLPHVPAVRRLLTAPHGKKLLIADVSQSQLRIAAELSGDRAMLRAYANGADLHMETAAQVLGIANDDVSKEERSIAKAVNFGLLFRQGSNGFATFAAREYSIDFTPSEAESIREDFFYAYPGLAAWQEEVIKDVEVTGSCETPGGRLWCPRNGVAFPSPQQALGFVIQGTEAEIMLDALTGLHKGLARYDAHLVHFVHDEVILEVSDEPNVIEAVSVLVTHSIAAAFRRMFPEASVDGLVEIRAAVDWG